jgi:hypothetical protein
VSNPVLIHPWSGVANQDTYSLVGDFRPVDVGAALSFTERPLQFCVCPCGTRRHKDGNQGECAGQGRSAPCKTACDAKAPKTADAISKGSSDPAATNPAADSALIAAQSRAATYALIMHPFPSGWCERIGAWSD